MADALSADNNMITLYLEPSSIDFTQAKKLLFDNGNDNYMNRCLDYVSENTKYSYTRFSYWPFESRHAMVIKLDS